MMDLQKQVNELERQLASLSAQYAADKRELLAEIEYRKTRAINLGLSFDQAEAETKQAQQVASILQDQVNSLTERLKAYEPDPIEDAQPQPVEEQPHVEG